MDTSTMMAVAILLPVVSAILVFAVRHYQARGFIVILTAVILSINAAFFLKQGKFTFTPSGPEWNHAISILDFLMLFFFVYTGISRKNWLVFLFAVTQLVPLVYFEFVMKAHLEVEPAFYVDNLAAIMTLIISIIGSVICVYAIKYIEDHEHHLQLKKSRQSRFLFWMIIFLSAMNGLVFANNLYWLYFFWECTTLCCYQLIAHDLTKEALNNACRALWIGSLGGTTFVGAIIFLYMNGGGSQALSMQHLLSGTMGGVLMILPLALLCFTGFTKAAQFPFQSWLLGAMVAPTPVSALLHSSTMVKAGVYLIIRLTPAYSPLVIGKLGLLFGEVVALVGGFTFLAGSLMAVSQTNGKRVLAYSTIANLGLIIACAGINTPLSIAAAIFLTLFHAVSKALLFLCAGTVEHIIWSREIDDMEALATKAPITTLIMGLGILSMFLPPFGMLLGKWMAFEATASIQRIAEKADPLMAHILIIPLVLLVLFFAVASAATIVFWAKMLGRVLQVLPDTKRVPEKISIGYRFPLVFLLVGVVVISIGIGPIYENFLALVVGDIIQSSQVYSFVGGLGIEGLGQQGMPAPLQIGSYPVLLLFVILLSALMVPFLMIHLRSKELRPIYLCGEQAGGADTDEYMTACEKKEKIQLGGFYYQRILGETAMNPFLNGVAINLLVILFGVALGVVIK